MTPNREDYLKTIYASNLVGKRITNKMISEELNISPPSVTEMIGKLISSKKITKDNQLGYVLSAAGATEAQNLLRKHRLWEVFLVKYLGYAWDTVHDDAEILEHATSDELADRLNEFLNHPEYCPHGSIIFGNKDSDVLPEKIQLHDLKKNQKGIIREVSDHRKFLNYLVSKQLEIGLDLKVLDIDEYDGTMTLETQHGVISVSDIATREIYVERTD